ncbi:Chromo domain-containing protein T09A5.8 [Leucoagaricus sp. SymC.cos]|nr:Chromo domain-containing protein T09A5.8 [Leucoagaricus sp. SymC.cos]
MIQGEEQYEVEGIINHRYCREGLQYLVKWKGYGHQENEWIHEEELTQFANELIQEYLKSHKMSPKTHLTPKRPTRKSPQKR